ncbi:MAG: F-type H+-transporting ATPase subunit alpha [bacterium]|nr:MAG: F-type H+-transporting ATPase subunit alpha [bacterium]
MLIIFAGNQGFLDDVPIEQVARMERELLDHMHQRFPEITGELEKSKKLTDELAKRVTSAITDFKANHFDKAAPARVSAPAAGAPASEQPSA